MRSLAARYRWHADVEFAGASDVYFEWADAIAGDAEVLARIESLPDLKRRAPLLFAAARFAGAPIGSYRELRPWLLEHWEDVAGAAASRSQQTNEAGRCGTLVPVLATIAGPIALLEVGASAGACLFPDRYEYEYVTPDGVTTYLQPSDGPSAVRLPCQIDAASLPIRLPNVVWRAGIDLNPLSFADRDDVAWLETLVWPEQTDRRSRLDAVASVIRPEPPRIEQGDALELLPSLAADAPKDATLVVFHSAVLAYFSLAARERFAQSVGDLDATWLSNEGPGALPWITSQVDPSIDIGRHFILSRDNAPIALTGAHGQSFTAL
jgi:hypothetical protein